MFPYPVGMALDDASRTWQQQEQLRMQAAMLRWSGRHGLELPTDALLRRMLPPPPAAPTKSTALLATKGAPTPLRSAARTAEASGLRAEAPAFVPGGERSGGAGAGPPVISVKKSSRGFAVVLLRDPAVIERGVQQRVAVACSHEVNAFMRCCQDAGHDPVEAFPPRRSGSSCSAEHGVVVRCVAGSLNGQGGAYDACKRDFKEVRRTRSEGTEEKSQAALRRGWSCAWKHFRLPLEQLIVTARAVGECRAAGKQFRDTETANEARYREMWKGTAL
mmetsp:Transcript_121134/g.339212  ORF Transcript_121134/g.339212 Transcript_121134/m.339212 type:complete len:276 (+) Transcript_121134:67-894(+)